MMSSLGDSQQPATADDPQRYVLTNWCKVSEGEVSEMVMAAPAKSCSLNPIPTFLLRECVNIVMPFLTVTLNSSLREGLLPAFQKITVGIPLLKEVSLEKDLKN